MSYIPLKMKDTAESYRIKKKIMFDLPMRLLILGKSQYAGKTNEAGNFFIRPFDENDVGGLDCYRNDFEGNNIYIVSPSTDIDHKWKSIIECKNVPEGNIFNSYNENQLVELYRQLEANYKESVSNNRIPDHVLIIMDDITSSGKLKSKRNGIICELFQRGRHILVSTVILGQYYTDIPPSCRTNATGCIIFDQPYSRMEAVYKDHGKKVSKKEFIQEFDRVTEEDHSYMAIKYDGPRSQRFLDRYFKPIPKLCQ